MISVVVKGPRGAGKSYMIKKFVEVLLAEKDFSGVAHLSDGSVIKWGARPRVSIREMDEVVDGE